MKLLLSSLILFPLMALAQSLSDLLKDILRPGYSPIDDPAEYPLLAQKKFKVEMSEPLWIVPSHNLHQNEPRPAKNFLD